MKGWKLNTSFQGCLETLTILNGNKIMTTGFKYLENFIKEGWREIREFIFALSSCNSNPCSLVSASVWFFHIIHLFCELSYFWTFACIVSSACDSQFVCLSRKVQLVFKAQFNHHLLYESFTEHFSHLLPSHISPSAIIMLYYHP